MSLQTNSSQIQFSSDALDEFQFSNSQNRRYAGKATQQSADIFSPEDDVPKLRPHAGQAQQSSVFSNQDVLTKPQGIRISGGGSVVASHLGSDFCPTEDNSNKHSRPHAGHTQHSSVFSNEDTQAKPQGIRVSGGGSVVASHLGSDFCPAEDAKSPRPYAGHNGSTQHSTIFSDEGTEVKQGIKRYESANKDSFGPGFLLEGDSYFQHRSRTSLSGSMSGSLGHDLCSLEENHVTRVSPHAQKMTASQIILQGK